ncbi:hypothetical protein SERLA73DRAFT_107166 [Serpula lacrymans var. lacrymans S7.3]|uniref:F-box domain-containing protein n=1 Tax=Serpula lacrymans var. lacrymans (strain S7.3) TaxID=936435 RepID=F8PVN5_SERL3|nr:hypothetical protein SERLA73DRAFT_107166 [Serpula lacrymans var. lacrymans S7.3]
MFQSPFAFPNHQQNRANAVSNAVFSRAPVYDLIFQALSPRSLIRTGRTCRVAKDAVYDFSVRAFNINRHLSRFFTNPLAFRSLQACTGTLISGSSAIQFLDRTFYPESDLDIYTHPGHAREVGLWLMEIEGYRFEHNSVQHADFKVELPDDWDGQERRVYSADNFNYCMKGVEAVYTFTKEQPGGEPLKVQLVDSKLNPLEVILNFHSTCVMNVIAFDAAYSLYPMATFEDRRALKLTNPRPHYISALHKYVHRGWRLIAYINAHDELSRSSFFLSRARWVNDQHSWIVPLNMEGVHLRPSMSPSSENISWDPVIHNSWTLARTNDEKEYSEIYSQYQPSHTTVCRYNYTVAVKELLYMLISHFKPQGKLYHSITYLDKSHWTWYSFLLLHVL